MNMSIEEVKAAKEVALKVLRTMDFKEFKKLRKRQIAAMNAETAEEDELTFQQDPEYFALGA